MGKLLAFLRPAPTPAAEPRTTVQLEAVGGLVRLEAAPGNWLVMTPGNARTWARALETIANTAEAQLADGEAR